MWKSKFSKSPHNHDHSHDHQPSFHSPSFEFNTLELYPRMRRTEFYYQTSIPEEYQSRDYEHPHNLDCPGRLRIEEYRKDKIIPPKNSEMRVIRDSYFS